MRIHRDGVMWLCGIVTSSMLSSDTTALPSRELLYSKHNDVECFSQQLYTQQFSITKHEAVSTPPPHPPPPPPPPPSPRLVKDTPQDTYVRTMNRRCHHFVTTTFPTNNEDPSANLRGLIVGNLTTTTTSTERLFSPDSTKCSYIHSKHNESMGRSHCD